MPEPVSDLGRLLREMHPDLRPGIYAYASLPPGAPMPEFTPLATFREPEGLTLVAPEEEVVKAGLPVLFRGAWIMLTVHSDLEASGLTAAFSAALHAEGIGCNVIAAAFHDHLFVPLDRAEDAMACLRRLQADGRSSGA